MSKYPYVSRSLCKTCNGQIVIKRARDISKKFCGPGCVGKFYQSKPTVYTSCEYCGNKFQVTSKTQNKFCSVQCSAWSKKKIHTRTCLSCGESFILKNIAYEKRGKGKYCSISCAQRKYNANYDFFETIDNEMKAYWLGFVFADGNVYRSTLTIKLSNKDKSHLKKFKENIDYDGPIKDLESKSEIRLTNKKMCKDLKRMGVLPAKTFSLSIPMIEKEFMPHFIRGFFDGDGCFYRQKNGRQKYFQIFTAASQLKTGILKYFGSQNIKLNCYNHSSGYSLQTGRQKNIRQIYNLLFANANIFLKRKKTKFEDYINESLNS